MKDSATSLRDSSLLLVCHRVFIGAVLTVPPTHSARPHTYRDKWRACGLAVLLLLCCSTAFGQLDVHPAPGNSLGMVTAPEAGKWIVVTPDFLPVQFSILEAGKVCVIQGKPGVYGVFFFPPGDAQPLVQRVTLGGASPDPPEPPDPPVPPGDRWAIIWEESLDRTPEQAALRTALKKQSDLELRWVDVTNLPQNWLAWHAKLPANQTLPALMVVAGDRLVRVVGLPSSVDAVKREVTR